MRKHGGEKRNGAALRPRGGLIPLDEAHGRPCPLPAGRRRGELQARMLAWQGGGQRRRFVPRKEPIKTSGASFSRLPTLDGRTAGDRGRWEPWDEGSGPLKQPAISLRPGSYVHEGVCASRGVADRPRDLWCLFSWPPLSSFFPSTFFSC